MMLRQWQIFIRKADSDFKVAGVLMRAEEIPIEQTLFHLQQAVEKLLKSLLSFAGIDPPRTHDVEVLVEMCEQEGIELPEYVEEFPKLTPYAVELRYEIVNEAPPNAEHLLKLTGRFFQLAKNLTGIE
ncbi:HEPN domain-containing protein [bacterium]|nr:HEPN domain-containing protein [bacterium]